MNFMNEIRLIQLIWTAQNMQMHTNKNVVNPDDDGGSLEQQRKKKNSKEVSLAISR